MAYLGNPATLSRTSVVVQSPFFNINKRTYIEILVHARIVQKTIHIKE